MSWTRPIVYACVLASLGLIATSLADQIRNDMAFTEFGIATGLGAVAVMLFAVVVALASVLRPVRD